MTNQKGDEMMLLKLPIFLEENNAKLLIKYDGERNIKNYTVRLLFKDTKQISLGKDTDSPYALLNELFENSEESIKEEVTTFYSNVLKDSIENLKAYFGNECVIVVLLEEREKNIIYTLIIYTASGTWHLNGVNYNELYEKIFLDDSL